MQISCISPKCNQFLSAIEWFHIKQSLCCVYTNKQLYISPVKFKCKIQGLMSMTNTHIKTILAAYLMLSIKVSCSIWNCSLIAHVMYIRKFNIKYLVMHKMQMHNGAISWLEYGSCVCKLLDYRPVHTHRPYSNCRLKGKVHN